MRMMWILVWMLLLSRAYAAIPLSASTNLAIVDVNKDASIDFIFRAGVVSDGDLTQVGSSLVPRNGASVLSASPQLPFFEELAEISMTQTLYYNSLDGSNILPVSGYVAQLDSSAGVWYFFAGGGLSYSKEILEFTCGIALGFGGEMHLGWIRFTRPDLNPETLFSVSDFDWNPIPGAPIRAGLPPEIPVATEVLPEGAGVRLSWPPGASSWILESTRSLLPPVVWEAYPAGGTYADVPPEDADRFFRLRRPE